MQIERAAKNSKPRNGFESSYNPPAAAAPQQPPQSQAASPPTTTQSIGGFVEVLGASYCSSCRGKLCGVTSSCSQCKRGVYEHCFVTVGVRGIVGVLHVPAEVVQSLWVTLIPNNASNANATCMLNVHLMVCVSNVLHPHARLALPLPKFVLSTQADVAAVEYIENPTGVCNCDCLFAEIDCMHCLRLHSEIDCLYCVRLHSEIACLFVVTPVVFLSVYFFFRCHQTPASRLGGPA